MTINEYIKFYAAIMQALLSVMMTGMNAILRGAKADPTIPVGSFGIYYKIQQIALFSAFGLSNTIISILSFNYGMKNKDRINDCIKYGLIDTAMITLILTIVFEVFTKSLSSLFALSGGTSIVWWTFPIAEIATCIISIFILKKTYKEKIAILEEKTDKKGQSDKSRASYYEIIANKKWGDKENYDICLDHSIGNEKVVNIICDYINEKNK